MGENFQRILFKEESNSYQKRKKAIEEIESLFFKKNRAHTHFGEILYETLFARGAELLSLLNKSKKIKKEIKSTLQALEKKKNNIKKKADGNSILHKAKVLKTISTLIKVGAHIKEGINQAKDDSPLFENVVNNFLKVLKKVNLEIDKITKERENKAIKSMQHTIEEQKTYALIPLQQELQRLKKIICNHFDSSEKMEEAIKKSPILIQIHATLVDFFKQKGEKESKEAHLDIIDAWLFNETNFPFLLNPPLDSSKMAL